MNPKKTSNTLFQGVFPVESSSLFSEIVAGFSLAALAIPTVMGYTKIAGTPVVTGLYTLLFPMLLFAVFGSSRQLVVSADSATAAILAAALSGMAAKGSSEYLALAGLLALMSSFLLILARIIGFGFMADFLSRTVLIGFLTGVGIQIALGELAGLLGLPGGGHSLAQKLIYDAQQISQINFYDLVTSLLVIIIILGAKKISNKIPGALIAVIGALVFGSIFDLRIYGVKTLGEIPMGMPFLSLPNVQWSWGLLQQLFPAAFSLFAVILAQSAATSRAYAAKYNEIFNEDRDLLGLGLANLGAAMSGTFVVNGSPSQTQMVDSAGGRSQLSHIITSLIVILVLLFLTKPLAHLPSAVLSAVVFLIGIQLIDGAGMYKIWKQRTGEFAVALITAIVVVFIGVEQGIVIAIFLSLMEHVRHSYRSQNNVLVLEKSSGMWKFLPVTIPQEAEPGLLFYRFAHTIYYANAQQLFDQVLGLVEGSNPTLIWFCIDASAVADVDFTAAETLRRIQTILQTRGIRICWANVVEPVMASLDKYELVSLFGKDAFYDNLDDVLKAYSRH